MWLTHVDDYVIMENFLIIPCPSIHHFFLSLKCKTIYTGIMWATTEVHVTYDRGACDYHILILRGWSTPEILCLKVLISVKWTSLCLQAPPSNSIQVMITPTSVVELCVVGTNTPGFATDFSIISLITILTSLLMMQNMTYKCQTAS